MPVSKGTRKPWKGQYGQPFCVQAPAGIQRACLIGMPSVTHFFDFNQRYVELMVRAGSGCPNVQVMPPPLAEMAPPGYYLLFIVDGAGVPSNGAFVRLAY